MVGPRKGSCRCSRLAPAPVSTLHCQALRGPLHGQNSGGHSDILRDVFLVLTQIGQKELHPFVGSYYLPQSVLFPAHAQMPQLFFVSGHPRALTALASSSESSLPTWMFIRGAPHWCLYPGVSFILFMSQTL